ncbi:hypothetical protein [Nitrosopumilus sp. S4]
MSEINELKKILKNHEKRILSLEKSNSKKSIPINTDDESIILSLIKNGFFDKPKKLNEIKKELKTKAKLNPQTKYADILVNLTSNGKLQRKQISHQWAYSKGG